MQGLFLHERWAQRYGVEHSPEELEAVHLRRAEDLLDAALQRDGRPLDVAREPAGRLPAMCRNLSVVLVAMLRAHGIEARARAGFATYFIPGWYEDHWVVELGDGRWVDPQIDDVQRAALGITFDPLDMPAGAFVPGPDAWRLLRGGADPASFGLSGSGLAGEWFVAGDVLYDLAAVGGVETLPWDTWDPMPGPDDEVDVALFDAYAEGRAAPPPVPAKVLNTRRGRVEELHQIA
ncbi:hypothetical protein Ade02nite_53480 [Paractinoplanes deccanensis]|uniref:Transglutaminase-like domain-containing protein n=1 Tax=Paractinoplanes deccanensis TaxID=113561 RepID=A0ABQ3Y9Q5_9ACTN|nr:hypothetical protein Ade02nite_53480 [Actinoplanes deccanensis]